MPFESLAELLKRWQAGELDLQGLENQIRLMLAATAVTPDAHIDMDRQRRCGFPEVIYAPGKTPEAIRQIFRAQQLAGQNSLATRTSVEQAEFVQQQFPSAV